MKTIAFLGILFLANVAHAAPISICHRYRDALGVWKMSKITIDSSYLQTHLRHGDQQPNQLGECPVLALRRSK